MALRTLVACALVALLAAVESSGNGTGTARGAPLADGVASAVPVILYHQTYNVVPPTEPGGVSLVNFTAQMDYLVAEGYHAIGLADYFAWLLDPSHPLPEKPVLITFDDNHATNAATTAILQARGLRAVMFVVTGFATNEDDEYGDEYLSWAQLDSMVASGVWEVGFHAGVDGHDEQGDTNCPFYYPCWWLAAGESPAMSQATWTSNRSAEIDNGMAALSSHFPGWVIDGHLRAFAVPWSDYGQFNGTPFRPGGSPVYASEALRTLFHSKFDVVFVGSPFDQLIYASYGMRYRHQVNDAETVEQFAGMLNDPMFGWNGTIDNTAPTISSFDLSDPYTGLANTTTSQTVNVVIDSSDDVAVMGWYLSENSTAPTGQSDYGLFAPTLPKTFHLSAGTGPKTVYAWVRDFKGNVSAVQSHVIDFGGSPPVPVNTIFQECFDLGTGDTNCANDSGDSNTVDSNQQTAWVESGSTDDARIENEYAVVRDNSGSGSAGASISRSGAAAINTAGLSNVRLRYKWGYNLPGGAAGDTTDDGDLVVQWKLATASTWTTLVAHDLPGDDTSPFSSVSQLPTSVEELDLGGAASNTTINIRFTTTSTEDSDEARIDDVLVVGDVAASFGASASSSSENASVAIPVSLSRLPAQTVTVDYAVTGGTASGGGVDYTLGTGTLTFTTSQLTQNIAVPLNDDLVDEDDETVVLRLFNPTNATLASPLQHVLRITDNDPSPSITLTAAPSMVESGSVDLTASLSAVSGRNVTVNLAYGGTATPAEYAGPSAIVIPAGSLSAQGTLSGVDDALDEDDEHVLVDIASVVNGTESGTQQVDITLTDNDPVPNVILAIAGSSMAEAGGVATVTATLNTVSGRAVTVNLGFAGSATLSDYSRSGTAIVIPAGATGGSITLTALQDTIDEDAETIVVDISSVTNGNEATQQQVSATVNDDDAPPTVTLSANPVSVSENGGVSTITATLSTVSGKAVTVNLALSGSATAGDYTIGATSIVIPAGSPSGTTTVAAMEDLLDEDNESVALDISGVTNGTESGTQTATVTITDNDPAPSVTLGVSGSPIAENGGQATVTASLSAASGRTVTVNLGFSGSASASDYTVSDTTIVIAPGQLNGSVTVTGTEDLMDEANEQVLVDITSVTNGIEGGSQQVVITISDDDTAGVTVGTPSGSTTTETGAGGPQTLALVLTSQPTANVTIDVTSSNVGEGIISGGSSSVVGGRRFVFTPGNWNTPQTVTVTGVDDAVDDGSVGYLVVIGASVSTDPLFNGTFGPSSLPFTNLDDDTAGFTVSAASGSTSEAGSSATFTLRLTSQPTGTVTVPIVSSDTTEGTASPATLTFTPANWNVTQVVTVSGVDDPVDDGNIAYTIVLGVAQGADYAGLDPEDVAITNLDNDTAGVHVSPLAGLTTSESGGQATFTLVLTSRPLSDVTIGLSSSDLSEGSVVPASVTFTPATWDIAQTVTVTGVDDAIQDGDVAYSVLTATAVSADPLYSGMSVADPSLTNADDDVPGFVVSAVSGNTTEALGVNHAQTFTIRLTTQPSASVTIGLSSNDTTEGTVLPSSLTFTPADWSTPKTVTVTGVNDDLDDGDVMFAIITTPAVSGDPGYDLLNPPDRVVTNVDDDTAGITVSGVTGTTSESGGTAAFTLVLNSQPTASVTVGLSSNDTTEGTVSPSSLTFTAGNWNVAQTVTVTGVEDFVDDGDVVFTIVTAPATSSDPAYSGIDPANRAVTNVDDDTAGITVSPVSAHTTEAGGTATFTVVLNSQPTANVTIGLSSNDTSEGTVSPASLSFTPGNWSTAQTVTVTGVNDDIDDGDQVFTVVTAAAVSTDAAYSGLNALDRSVTNDDDDAAGITVSAVSGNTTETGATATFTIVLNSQPTANVTIGLSSNDLTEGTVAPSSLTFTPANWSTPQTVTVTGVDDLVDDGDVGYSAATAAATSPDGMYSGLNPADRALTNLDNDTAGISLSAVSSNTTEAGGTAAFTVVLNSQPTANVTIGLNSNDTTEGTVSPASLTLTPGNWNVAQTVTVTGVDDFLDDGDVAYQVVTAVAISSDATYSGMNAADRMVTNLDDDTSGITVSAVSGATTEAGGSATFTVVLTAQPMANVTIGISSDDTSEGTVSPISLTFTAGNWNTAQTVTVTGVDDFVDDGDISYAVLTAPAVSVDGAYNGIDAANRAVTNLDDDTAGINVSAVSGTTTEAGGTASLTVVLNSQPTAEVTIGLSSDDLTEGTVSPADLTFTPGNWNTARTVTVTGVDDVTSDGDVVFHVVTAAAASADAKYDGINPVDRSVTNLDNDTPGITVSAVTGDTSEAGASSTLTVVLKSQPEANVTIDLSSNDVTEGIVSPSSLVFTPVNWSTPQVITITGVDDQVDDGDVTYAVLTAPATSTDGDYAGMNAVDRTLVNVDDDTAEIVVSAIDGDTTEAGGTATFSVVLGSQPTASVTIGLSSGDATEGTVFPASITFTTGNWDAARLVTVTGVNDFVDDGDIDYVIVTAAPASDDLVYEALNAGDVDVTNVDDDTAGITVSGVSGNTTEAGGQATFTVVLESQPVANVSFDVASSDASEGSADPATLVFTPANWNVAQTVTVTGVDDVADDGDIAYAITVAAASSDDAAYDGRDPANVTLKNIDDDDPQVLQRPTVQLAPLARYTKTRVVPVTVTGGLGAVSFLLTESPTEPAPTAPGWRTTPPKTFTLSNKEGRHTVYAWVKSSAGVVGLPASRVTVLDRTAPATTILSPKNGGSIRRFTAIRGVTTDQLPGSGAARVLVSIRRQAGKTCFFWSGGAWVEKGCASRVWIRLAVTGNGHWSMTKGFTLPAFQKAGTYSIFARGVDRLGNRASASRFVLGKNWVRFVVR